MTFKKYTFADGTVYIVRNFDRVELSHKVQNHGKVIKVEKVQTNHQGFAAFLSKKP